MPGGLARQGARAVHTKQCTTSKLVPAQLQQRRLDPHNSAATHLRDGQRPQQQLQRALQRRLLAGLPKPGGIMLHKPAGRLSQHGVSTQHGGGAFRRAHPAKQGQQQRVRLGPVLCHCRRCRAGCRVLVAAVCLGQHPSFDRQADCGEEVEGGLGCLPAGRVLQQLPSRLQQGRRGRAAEHVYRSGVAVPRHHRQMTCWCGSSTACPATQPAQHHHLPAGSACAAGRSRRPAARAGAAPCKGSGPGGRQLLWQEKSMRMDAQGCTGRE